MRTRKFLSTLIPALPMLLAALLVIIVTVIFLTAMRSKAHAQFGGVEQPMFQLTSVQEQWQTAEQELLQTAQYRWVDLDLSNGLFNTWTDRIAGASFVLPQTLVGAYIIKDTNGVVFDGNNLGGVNLHFLTNATLSWRTNTSIGFMIRKGPIMRDLSGAGLWMYGGAAADFPGFAFGSGAGNQFVFTSSGGNLNSPIYATNWVKVIFSQYHTNASIYGSVYTNGVASLSGVNGLGFNLYPNPPYDGPQKLAFRDNTATTPSLYIKEIWVWTNNAYFSTNGFDTSTNVIAKFNTYCDGRYPVVISNEWAYSKVLQLDADYGLSDPSGNAAVNGSKIATWTNSSFAPWHMTQTGGDNLRPYWVSSGGPNNMPYVTFPTTNANGACLTNSYNTFMVQTNLLFFVVRFKQGGAGQALFDGVTGARHTVFFSNNRQVWTFSNSSLLAGPDGGVTTNVWYLLTCCFNGSNSYMRTNGVTYQSAGDSGTGGLSQFVLGNYNDYITYPCYADISAVRIYTHGDLLSSNQIRNIEVEMGTKYGITIP